MRFYQNILNEGYKEAKVEFTAKSSLDEVNSYIERFKELVKSNKAKGDERNIDYWRKQGWDKFKEFVAAAEQTVSGKALKKQSKEVGKAIILKETDKWLIVVPLDKSASCFYGKDTTWCTTKPYANYYEQYFYERGVTLIYCLNKESGSKWAIAFHNKLDHREYFDQDDNSISQDDFDSETGLSSDKIVAYATSKYDQIQSSRDKFKEEKEELERLLKARETGPHVEQKLIYVKNLRKIIDYLRYSFDSGKKVSDVLLKMAAQLTRDSIYAELPQIPSSYDQTELFEIKEFPEDLKNSIIKQVIDRLESIFPDHVQSWRVESGEGDSRIGFYIKIELESRSEDTDYIDLLSSVKSSTFFKKLKKKIPTDVLEEILDKNLSSTSMESIRIIRGIICYAAAHAGTLSPERIKQMYEFSDKNYYLGGDKPAFIEIIKSGDREISKVFAKILKNSDESNDWYPTTSEFLIALLESAPEDIALHTVNSLSNRIINLITHRHIDPADLPSNVLNPKLLVPFILSTEDPVYTLIELIPLMKAYITPEVAHQVLETSGETIDNIIASTTSSAGKKRIAPLVKLLRPNDKAAIPDYASLIRDRDRDTINDYREILKQTNNDPNIIAALAEVGIVPGNINYTEDLISKIIDNSKSFITIVMLSSTHARLMDITQVQSKLKELNLSPDEIEKMVAYVNKAKQPDAVTEIKRLAGLK